MRMQPIFVLGCRRGFEVDAHPKVQISTNGPKCEPPGLRMALQYDERTFTFTDGKKRIIYTAQQYARFWVN